MKLMVNRYWLVENRLLPFIALVAVYVIGAFAIDIMDIDAAQYANISREMADNNNFLQVQYRQQDYYLDKPPLLFWLTALIFKLFGASNFTYRLIPILSTLGGIYAIYRFSKLYYTTQTAYITALVMGSCQAFFLMNHDVRCDTLLTNFVTMAIWLLAEYLVGQPHPKSPESSYRSYRERDFLYIDSARRTKLLYLIGAFVCMGLGMLAKGPIALIVVGAAFFIDFALKRQWNQIFKWEWLAGIGIIGITLTPYCIGLYRQYGIEGIYFFFWKQSFGRITGESEWNNSPGLFFQAQNFLWSFLPWVIPFVIGLAIRIRDIVQQKFRIVATDEAISLGGFTLPFMALSTSHYQLPHYTFILFPLAAVLTARYLASLIDKASPPNSLRSVAPFQLERGSSPNNPLLLFKFTKYSLVFTCCLMILVVVILSTWAFPLKNIFIWAAFIGGIVLIIKLFSNKRSPFSVLVLAPFFTAVVVNFLMNSHFYPSILPYQTGSQLGQKLMREQKVTLQHFYKFDVLPNEEYELFHDALDFYTRRTTPTIRRATQIDSLVKQQPIWLFTEHKGIEALKNQQLQIDTLWQHDRFHVTGLTLPFLNPTTRYAQTTKQYLIKVTSP